MFNNQTIRRVFRNLITYFCLLLPLVASGKEYVSHLWQEGVLSVKTTRGQIQFTPLSEAAVSVNYLVPHNNPVPSFAITETLLPYKAEFSSRQGELQLSLGQLDVQIKTRPLRVEYFRNGERLIGHESGFFHQEAIRGVRLALDAGEQLYGGGQRVLGMDRRGHKLPLYNRAHYGYSTESNQMYYGLPAVMSSKHYAVIFDNIAKGAMDLGAAQSDVLQFEAVAGRNAYVVVSGQDQADLIDQFTNITGRQPLPPRWALGNFASRFGYRSGAEIRDVVQRYQRADMPLDAVVIDLYWFGKDMKGYMGNLAWDRQAFPGPEQMMADLAKQGVQTVVITEPYILNTSDNWQSAVDSGALARNMSGAQPRVFDMFFGTGGLVDVFSPKGQQWFWQKYKDIINTGVNGIWGDLGEPEVHPSDTMHVLGTADEVHNGYGHQWAKLVQRNFNRDFPNKRLFLLMRSGFVGSQRYGMMPWTGDVSRSWGGLKPQVELALQMGVMGLGYIHSDLGGFLSGDPDSFDAEMYTRWLQFGAFTPIYRPHAHESIAPEPVFHDQQTQDRVRKFIKLRYRLLPYNYSLAFENSSTGMPLMRPLAMSEPGNEQLFTASDAYLWGHSFFVYPITDPGVTLVNTYLPEGYWFDFWNKQPVQGGKNVEIEVSPETIPVLVKAGSLIPAINDVRHTGEFRGDRIQLHYFHHNSVSTSSGQWYHDDGEDPNAISRQQYRLTQFSASNSDTELQISLAAVGGGYQGMPSTVQVELNLHGMNPAGVETAFISQHAKRRNVPVSTGVSSLSGTGSQVLKLSFDWSGGDVALTLVKNQEK